jgi:hypothetical protein
MHFDILFDILFMFLLCMHFDILFMFIVFYVLFIFILKKNSFFFLSLFLIFHLLLLDFRFLSNHFTFLITIKCSCWFFLYILTFFLLWCISNEVVKTSNWIEISAHYNPRLVEWLGLSQFWCVDRVTVSSFFIKQVFYRNKRPSNV